MDDIEKFLNSASLNEKQLLGKFVGEMAEALRKTNISENTACENDLNVTVESSFALTKPPMQDDTMMITFKEPAPTPTFERPCTASERPMTAPEQQRPATADDRPATAEQRPATSQGGGQPVGLPTKGSILETRKPTPAARSRDRHALFKDYMEKLSEARQEDDVVAEDEEAQQTQEVRDTRSALENKYRPQSRSSETRARTAERVRQSRQGARKPAKFEETLRGSNDERTRQDEECDNCLRKKLISSLVDQLNGMELEKLEQIIAGDGLRPVVQQRVASARTVPTYRNLAFVPSRDTTQHNHGGANFQQVNRKDPGHFVINKQFGSEYTEPTNNECATIIGLVP